MVHLDINHIALSKIILRTLFFFALVIFSFSIIIILFMLVALLDLSNIVIRSLTHIVFLISLVLETLSFVSRVKLLFFVVVTLFSRF